MVSDQEVDRPDAQTFEELVTAHLEGGRASPLELKDRHFTGPQRLRGLTIGFDIDLERSRFDDGLEVQSCTFNAGLNVSDVEFGGRRADFADSVFRGRPVFRPRHASLLSIRSSTFHAGFEIALPRKESIDLDLRFAAIAGTAVIRPLDYGQPGAAGLVAVSRVEASEAMVGKESSLELSGFKADVLHLGELVLHDKASVYLSDVQAKELYFNDLRLVDKANVGFNRVDLTAARFSGSNVERFAFSNVNWPRLGARVVLLEEAEWRQGLSYGRPASVDQLNDGAERVIENYRQLVLNFEGKRNYELAEEFHTSEMEMLRQRAGSRLPAFLGRLRFHLSAYGLYRVLSGYGADYQRAAVLLLVLLMLFSGAFMLNGVSQRAGGGFEYDWVPSATHRPVSAAVLAGDCLRAVGLTLSIVTLQKDRPMDPVGVSGSLLSSLLLLLAPAQAALLLFALRRRFRRASI